jgi:hypothetical protein
MQLDDLEMRHVEPDRALIGRQRGRDVLRPPLAVGAGVAVAEADDPLSVAGDEEDEVVALGVQRQPVARPLVG